MKHTMISMTFIALFTMALFGAIGRPGQAANPIDITATLGVSTSLTIAEPSVNFGNLAGFSSGAQTPVTLNLNARCNKKNGYTVTVHGAAANFASVDGDPASFPLADLEFYSYVTSGYEDMDTADKTVRTTAAKTGPAGEDFTVPVRLNLLGTEAAGTYTTSLTFTISAN